MKTACFQLLALLSTPVDSGLRGLAFDFIGAQAKIHIYNCNSLLQALLQALHNHTLSLQHGHQQIYPLTLYTHEITRVSPTYARKSAPHVTRVSFASLQLIRATVCRPLDSDLALACAMALHPRLGRASHLAALGSDLMLQLLEGYCCGVPRVWL